MGKLTGEVSLTPLGSGGGRNWREDTPFKYIANNGDETDVEAGFTTDLASVPRPLWTFWPPEGLYTIPAVIHDKNYTLQKFTRARCDAILLESMKDFGVPWYDRWPIYAGVRIGGWVAWNEHAAKNKEAQNGYTDTAPGQ